MNTLIEPHGGQLINRVADEQEKQRLIGEAQQAIKIEITSRSVADIECIATGVYSPLTGFLNKQDYESVVERMRLANNTVFSIPVTLPIPQTTAQHLAEGQQVALTHKGMLIAMLTVGDIYTPDKQREADLVYQTIDKEHPGVKAIYESEEVYLGGDIICIDLPKKQFPEQSFTPEQTRKYFSEKGWKTVVAFQTRNPIHRAHEYLQKVALEMVDGLFINPLVGTTKNDDVPADVRMHTYEVIIDKYYPKERVLLGTFPAAMRYAGPREAIMHAIARQNYGVSHFIVGRDHAGVGDYYGTYDAQKIFDSFTKEELNITPLKFEHAFYCTDCLQMVSGKTCPHESSSHVFLSGTKVREMLSAGELPPAEFTRKEVAEILAQSYQSKQQATKKGFTLWFTGLSGSGKSTLAQAVAEELSKRGKKFEILDGDIVRTHLTKGLGFSKEDRDENIRRIGFVAHLLTKQEGICITAAISPYKSIRDEVREKIGNFIEVYAEAPLNICEERDVKGLYKKARAGEIKGFTGIDDPYEIPENPEVTCHTDRESIQESTQKIITFLEEQGYL